MPQTFIYHLISPTALKDFKELGIYRPLSLEQEGFIHLSFDHQVYKVAQRFYQNQKMMILRVDSETLGSSLIVEGALEHQQFAGHESETFPHFYGALELSMVDGVADYEIAQTLKDLRFKKI